MLSQAELVTLLNAMFDDGALLSPSQAAKLLDVTPQYILQLCATDRLSVVRCPMGRLLLRDDVLRFKRERDERRSAKANEC